MEGDGTLSQFQFQFPEQVITVRDSEPLGPGVGGEYSLAAESGATWLLLLASSLVFAFTNSG